MSAYRTTIDYTTQVIGRRLRWFRIQAMGVMLTSVLSIVWALVDQSVLPLMTLAALLPMCGAFLFVDNQILDDWRCRLYAGWVVRDLDMTALRHAIRANPALPKHTTEGMLGTLPSADDLAAEQALSSSTRQAIAAALLSRHRSHADALAFKVAAAALSSGALLTAAAMHRWEPLAGLCGLVLVPIGQAWLRRVRRGESVRALAACRVQPDFSETDMIRLLGTIELNRSGP